MKSLSFDQMARIEGGNSAYCRSALGLYFLALATHSFFLFIIALGALNRFCGGYGGGDSTCGVC